MDGNASWTRVFVPLAAIGIAPFMMWLRAEGCKIESQARLTGEKAG